MASPRIFAVTGTPGSGKTTLCSLLGEQGYSVESVIGLAARFNCLGEQDARDGAAPVDIHKLADEWFDDSNDAIFVDGHLSHLLEIDAVVLIRCHPDQLKQRLEARGYDERKVQSNVEWEMIAGTWSEILEFELDVPILEIDGSATSDVELMSEVLQWIEDGCPSDGVEATAAEAIDWLA